MISHFKLSSLLSNVRRFSADVKFNVVEKGLADDILGVLEVPVSDIAAAYDFNPLSGARSSQL